jgi:U3 small nucleolar RNA-associated protein 12
LFFVVLQLLVALQNNSIELYQIRMGTKGDEEAKEGENNEDNETEKKASEKIATVELPGHRGDIRSLALSSNDEMLLSTSSSMSAVPMSTLIRYTFKLTSQYSADLLKIWNMHTLNCIRTIKTGYGLSAAFIPGDSHVVIGTKAGSLELYDLQAARQLEVVEGAHKGAIWGIQLRYEFRCTMY